MAVAEIDKKQKLSRITLVTSGSPEVILQIKKQLEKLVPVHKVADFMRNDPKIIFRDMALLKVISNNHKDPIAPMSQIKVLPYKEKNEWELIPKYNIGVVNK